MQRQQWPLWMTFGATLVLLAVLIGLLLLGMSAQTSEAEGAFYNGLARRLTPDGAPLLGSPSAPVTVVEFTDFSCPHCADYGNVIQALIDRYVRPGKARLELRVLSGLDPTGSVQAARAALCAGEQGAFWEMHDELFRLQEVAGYDAFSTDRLSGAAAALNLDGSLLTLCIGSASRYQEALQNNIDLAITLGVRTLPAVLLRVGDEPPRWIEVDGEPLTGPVPLDTLGAAIEAIHAPGS